MITNLSPQAQSFLAEMDRVQQMVSDASRQVSSGLRVSQASDDPDVISRLLQLRAALQKNTQITTNLGQAQTDANVSESALSSAAQLMDQAVSLASQGLPRQLTLRAVRPSPIRFRRSWTRWSPIARRSRPAATSLAVTMQLRRRTKSI